MRLPSRQRTGIVLVLIAIVGIVVSFGLSAATAPSLSSEDSNGTAERGQTLVGMQAAGQVAMLNANSSPVWTTGAGNVDYFDVTMLENGSVLTGFLIEGQQSCGQYQSPCSRTGFRIIDPDPEPRIISEWTFPVRTKLNSEVHDANLLPSGEILMTDMDNERIFTVAPNGSVTWQWNGSERYDAPPDPTQTDWLHINDVDRISPDRYMVSVRNANQLVVVERGEGVVDVINEDTEDNDDANCKANNGLADYNNDSGGDVLCGDPETMDHQHNPQSLGPNTTLVADSENDRVVELHRENESWEVVWGADSANGIGFDWPRDADRLPNGNTLITDTRNNRIVEVTPNGETVWTAETGIWPYDAERLPYGELLSSNQLDRMNSSGSTPSATAQSTLPLLDQARAGLSYIVPLPAWFQPWHIGLLVIAAVLLLSGGGLIVSGYRR